MATTFNLGNIKGDQGFQGRETIKVYQEVTLVDRVSTPPAIPTGGSVAEDGIITPPTNWHLAPPSFDVETEDLYSTELTWNPATDPAPFTFGTWGAVVRDNGRFRY